MLSNVEDDDDDFEVSAGGKTKICLKRITILFCVCLCCTIFILGALYVAGVFVCGGWTLQKCTNAVWNAF